MKELGVSWDLTTDFIAYTPFDIEPSLRAEVVPKIGTAVANGIRWFPGHAPVGGGRYRDGHLWRYPGNPRGGGIGANSPFAEGPVAHSRPGSCCCHIT